MTNRIICIDPGNISSGVVVLDDTKIIKASNEMNVNLFNMIGNYCVHKRCTVVMEDIRPYNMRITQQLIDTCKFIGEAVFRLREQAGLHTVLIPRYEVKKWVYDSFYDVIQLRLSKKLSKGLFPACSIATREAIEVNSQGRKKLKGSFIYVDDVMVKDAMRSLYDISIPAPGKGYDFGLQDHSWQSLACARYFMTKDSD